MGVHAIFVVVVSTQLLLTSFFTECLATSPTLRTDNKCLKGANHKEFASPEGPEYAACHQFQTKSCCTANFTEKLATATVTRIDNFHWDRCGALSKRCEEFMIAVECFYRCSPNVIHWEGTFPSSLNRVPVCHQFCDDWYEACKAEMSCASNWITGFNRTSDGSNLCRDDSSCQTWEQRYGNSRTMCDVMWGQSFRYTTDTTMCLHINGTVDFVEKNAQAVNRILGSSAPSIAVWSLPFSLIICTLASFVPSLIWGFGNVPQSDI